MMEKLEKRELNAYLLSRVRSSCSSSTQTNSNRILSSTRKIDARKLLIIGNSVSLAICLIKLSKKIMKTSSVKH